ncbi:hypothetical protein ABK040_001167 [Willaertia magna]
MITQSDCWFHICSFLCLEDLLTIESCCKELQNILQEYDQILFEHRLQFILLYSQGNINYTIDPQTTSHKTQLLQYLRELVNHLKEEITNEYLYGGLHNENNLIQLSVKCGANNFKTLQQIKLGNLFSCSVHNRITEMKNCLELMGWAQYSTNFDLLLFKYYTYRAIFPKYPNNVAGIVVKEPLSMVPGKFSRFFHNAMSPYEEPSFVKSLDEEGKFVARFWILHYNELAKGFISGHSPLSYSLLEIKVKYSEPLIDSVSVLNNLLCPRQENFKAHGGCLVM